MRGKEDGRHVVVSGLLRLDWIGWFVIPGGLCE